VFPEALHENGRLAHEEMAGWHMVTLSYLTPYWALTLIGTREK